MPTRSVANYFISELVNSGISLRKISRETHISLSVLRRIQAHKRKNLGFINLNKLTNFYYHAQYLKGEKYHAKTS